MTALDNIKAALEAGPTEGPWHTVQVGDNPTKFAVANAEGISLLTLVDEEGHDFAAVYEDADSDFIAACNPTAIRELLAYVESLEKDAARWRAIRKQHEECDSGITMCVFQPVNGESLEPVGCMPGELDAAVDAIDAAMEQTK